MWLDVLDEHIGAGQSPVVNQLTLRYRTSSSFAAAAQFDAVASGIAQFGGVSTDLAANKRGFVTFVTVPGQGVLQIRTMQESQRYPNDGPYFRIELGSGRNVPALDFSGNNNGNGDFTHFYLGTDAAGDTSLETAMIYTIIDSYESRQGNSLSWK